MPNWCDNSLGFQGNTEDDLKLVELFKQDHPFQAIYPCPEELDAEGAHSFGGPDKDKQDSIRAQLTEKYGYQNGYAWRVANWGTKWDACDLVWIDDTSFCFNTAWSPPVDFYRKMSELYPNASFSFEYSEPGVGFAGGGRYFNGNFQDHCGEYDYSQDDPDDPDDWEPEVIEQSKPSQTTVIGSYTIPKLP